jgi:hypothetical protein
LRIFHTLPFHICTILYHTIVWFSMI